MSAALTRPLGAAALLLALLTPAGALAQAGGSTVGEVGQRQTRQDAAPNVDVRGRIDSRINSRIASRIDSRITRDSAAPQDTSAASRYASASRQARTPRR